MTHKLVGIALPHSGNRPPRVVFDPVSEVMTIWGQLLDQDRSDLPESWESRQSDSSDTAFRLYCGYESLTIMTLSDYHEKFPNSLYSAF